MNYYDFQKRDGYYAVLCPDGVVCYLIEGSEKAMLIDTGYGYGDFSKELRRITNKPLIIINTHGHCDHVGGNGWFTETCYLHEKDKKLAEDHTAESFRSGNIERAKHSMNYETGEEFNCLPDDFHQEKYLRLGTGKLEAVKEGDIFVLGGATMEIIETPGHTQGGISVYYKEKNLLFIGDAAGFFVWLFAPETTSRAEYIDTLKKMYALNADGYLGGHNPVPIKREQFLDFIRAAKEADYEKGEPFVTPIFPDSNARVCAIDGMTMADMFKPGFASLVISADK